MFSSKGWILVPAMICVLGGASCGLQSSEAQTQQESRTLAGTWRFETSGVYTFQRIFLVLRADGSYTKTLEARVNGAPYGGTHSGRWTARGTVVSLSGDATWPAVTHDLAEFAKD